jgi:PhnB protein
MAKVNPVPKDMHTLTPNLTIKDCGRAIDFYKRAFGAEERMRMPTPDGKGVWHAELKIGDSIVFMNDEMPEMPIRAPAPDQPAPVGMWLYVGDCDAAFKRAVDAGAKADMPPTDMFWGDRTASVVDGFGYRWTMATHVKDLTEEEMRKGGEEFARKFFKQH